jgi:hypothetical protein
VKQGHYGPCSLFLETRDKRFDFLLLQKDEMLGWKNDICSRIPVPDHHLNAFKLMQTPDCKQDYREEESIPDVKHLTAPSLHISIPPPICSQITSPLRDLKVLMKTSYHKQGYAQEESTSDLEHLDAPSPVVNSYISIPPPAYSPGPESQNAKVESKTSNLNEGELAMKEAYLQAKERVLEWREEEVRRREMELQWQAQAMGMQLLDSEILANDLHRHLKEVEPRYQPEMEPERGPPQKLVIFPNDAISSGQANTLKDAGLTNPASISVVMPLSTDASKGK